MNKIAPADRNAKTIKQFEKMSHKLFFLFFENGKFLTTLDKTNR